MTEAALEEWWVPSSLEMPFNLAAGLGIIVLQAQYMMMIVHFRDYCHFYASSNSELLISWFQSHLQGRL